MPKIKHIALSTQDVEKTARFYIEVFGMKEVGKINDPGTRGCFLTDGDINLAILNFKKTRRPVSSAEKAGAASTTSASRWKLSRRSANG